LKFAVTARIWLSPRFAVDGKLINRPVAVTPGALHYKEE
jgi:hypothetical protein